MTTPDGGGAPPLPRDLHPALATVRAFVAQGVATRVAAIVDLGGGRAALLDCARDRPIEVVLDGCSTQVAFAAALEAEPTLVEPLATAITLEVDPASGEVAGPLGALERLATDARRLSQALGGASAVTVQFETSDPQAPLAIAARVGEPLILALGEEQFPMPPEWPGGAGAQ